jgi:hypothetical protein
MFCACSTTLWEVLDETTADVCVKLHHSIIRETMAKHTGYEVRSGSWTYGPLTLQQILL